ncbi:NAD(P)/FAD-dependent oxidoreductase [Patescibacteria group bacterium]|nr:NAD(P)/FAD-dependent oxidoreductase [Patescibacteria group bacterium]MBU1673870.1 NAD(P)/FAD-dependent oxidoreductase [Patescibacteria group bacterium]MBU1963247.1 NAD(P)/FAD-dependent oxidoreductase [Patescibacteria group bacterium]
MIAAGHAAELGSRVLLLEKNPQLGIKLLMTGKGRCNITNAEEDIKKLIEVYGKNGKFLYSALNKFSNKDVVEFFESKGLKTKVERGNRIFATSDSSKDVVTCLENYLKENNVEIKLNSPVEKIIVKEGKIEKIILKKGQEITADKYIIATGGKSYPGSGSSGDAYKWLEKMGHTINKPIPALTPIIVKEKIVEKLEGLSLKNVEASLWDNKKIASFFGEALFTNNGMSGPIILNLSKIVSENPSKNLKLKIDFKPALDFPTLDKRIQRDFEENSNKQYKNSINKLMPAKLIPVMIELSKIDPNKKVNEITKEERKRLIKLLKEFELNVNGVVGFEKAIVTSGGVDIKEVNPKTMQSKIIDNLFLAGEVLDIDGPTGGYNLQVAWSTGYLAGEN